MSIVVTEDRGAVRHSSQPPGEAQRDEPGAAARARRGAARGRRRQRRALRRAARRRARVLRRRRPRRARRIRRPGRACCARFAKSSSTAPNLCEEMAKPVVCQIHRTCVGGALEVALGCDLRIASSDSQFGLPEVKFGIIPDVGGSTRLPAVVGLGRAKELIMTARTIDAAEAERIGLVNRVVAPEELEQATQALVDELLANSHIAVGRAKRVIDASARPRSRRRWRWRSPCRSTASPPRARARARRAGRGAPRRRRASGRSAPVHRPGDERVAAERAAEDLLRARARTPAARAGRCRSRCPSRAASRRGPRWRCCRWRRPAPGSRRARRSSTRSCRRRPRSAASTLARPCPRVLWKCAVSSTLGPSSARARGEELAHLARVGHAGGVAEADLLRARVAQARGDLEHALGRHVALVGAAEGRRDHALAAQPLLARARRAPPRSPLSDSLDRAVHVLAVVRLGGRQEDVDLVECGSRLAAQRARRARARWGPARDTATSVGDVDRAPAPRRRRRAAGSRRRARSSSPPAAAGRCARARRSARPCRRWGSPRARSGSRRAGRPRGCSRCAGIARPMRAHHIDRPPLTSSVWPVTYEASSPARKAIAAATSSGSPERRRAVAATIAA